VTGEPAVGASQDDSTAIGRAQQQLLRGVHNHLRDELTQLLDVVAQVMAGAEDPVAARGVINRLTLRANYWTLGSFCAAYCRIVAMHHTIEDEAMFPGLAAHEPSVAPVVARLQHEHELIAEVLTGLDEALIAMMSAPPQISQVRARADELAEQLLAHLAYEEQMLLPVIGRLNDRVV
jgi:iron-sulfur cluster repair protein YtfE (RIC family)